MWQVCPLTIWVLAAVNRNGFNLQFAAVILKSDKEVVLAAVN